MGLPGFTSLIEENSELLFDRFNLARSEVVVDGSSLCHQLMATNKINIRFGGEYPYYRQVVMEFFTQLLSVGLRPIVFMDGALDPEHLKRDTLMRRLNLRVHSVQSLLEGGPGQVLPLFAHLVFRDVCQDLQIPIWRCVGDADQSLAVLANSLRCPLISRDSDFYIFPLKVGYIPLNSLRLPPTEGPLSEGPSIQCQIFRCQNLLTRCFPTMNSEMLPVFAVLWGNDFVPTGFFEPIFKALPPSDSYQGRSGRRKTHFQFKRSHMRMISLLQWLSTISSAEEALEAVLKLLPESQRAKAQDVFHCCLPLYQCAAERELDIFSLVSAQDSLVLPEWFQRAHAENRLPSEFLRILQDREHILAPQVEDLSGASSHQSSLPFRKALYSVLFPNSSQQQQVLELTTEKRKVVSKPISFIGRGLTENIHAESAEERRRRFFELSGLIPMETEPELELFFLATKSWLHNCSVAKHHLLSVCLCAWALLSEGQLGTFLKEFNVTPNSVISLSEKSRKKRLKQKKEALCLKSLHAFAEWQALLHGLHELNAALDYPLRSPPLHLLFSGRIVYNLAVGPLANQESPITALRLLFHPNQEKLQDFLCFLKPISNLLSDATLFDSNRIAKKFSRRIPKSSEPLNERESEPGRHCDHDPVVIDVNNKFSLLQLI